MAGNGDGVSVSMSPFAGAAAGQETLRTHGDGLAYFRRFGVDEPLLRAAFDKALSRGADWAELFFQHRIGHHVGLEDGAVNRAYSSVSLGVGVRVIKGDQTGYAYTEELTRKAVADAAGIAAVVADGPSR
ncbi:MAG: hypothetical protein KC613_16850, partial [Myxococcales bacterium]|nr:hypothetical protein [Myxococcales bacterium]